MSRQKFQNQQGQTMVEFALVVPLLCLLLFGIIQFGILYNNYITLTDATRAGARKAAVSRHESDPVGVATSAVRSSASDLKQADLGVTVTASSWTTGSNVTVRATYPYELNLLGLPVASGTLTSSTTERIE